MIKTALALFSNPWVILATLALFSSIYALGHYNGSESAKNDQEKVDAKAQKRIDSVPNVDSDGINDRLRKGTF